MSCIVLVKQLAQRNARFTVQYQRIMLGNSMNNEWMKIELKKMP